MLKNDVNYDFMGMFDFVPVALNKKYRDDNDPKTEYLPALVDI